MTDRAAGRWSWRKPSILPLFGPALGFSVAYLSLIVLLPLSALALKPWSLGLSGFLAVLVDPRVTAALKLSFGAAALAAAVNVVAGGAAAWALTRYRFPGRALLDAAIDLPFALPTAVAGIALATLYAPSGWFGAPLQAFFNLKVAYTPIGVFVALLTVGLPFVVRSVQPVLQAFEKDVEEAAYTLGAGPWRRAWTIVFPALAPAMVGGFGLAFARAVGEYGSVIFIAGNMPMKSEIAPLIIVTKLEQFNYAAAAAVGLIMLTLSLFCLFLLNRLQFHLARRGAA
jgi:sulfate/thiosulfate transport system permease protein